jgi:hypothetical protein
MFCEIYIRVSKYSKILNLKKATAVFAETLENFQHCARRIHEIRNHASVYSVDALAVLRSASRVRPANVNNA